jgi:hypothetical protein
MLRTISQPRMTKKMPRLVWEAAGAQVCVGKMGEVGFDCRRCGVSGRGHWRLKEKAPAPGEA